MKIALTVLILFVGATITSYASNNDSSRSITFQIDNFSSCLMRIKTFSDQYFALNKPLSHRLIYKHSTDVLSLHPKIELSLIPVGVVFATYSVNCSKHKFDLSFMLSEKSNFSYYAVGNHGLVTFTPISDSSGYGNIGSTDSDYLVMRITDV